MAYEMVCEIHLHMPFKILKETGEYQNSSFSELNYGIQPIV